MSFDKSYPNRKDRRKAMKAKHKPKSNRVASNDKLGKLRCYVCGGGSYTRIFVLRSTQMAKPTEFLWRTGIALRSLTALL